MRKFAKQLFSIGIAAFCSFCAPVYAGESYLYLGFKDVGKVYRLTSSDQNQLPTGYVFACESDADAFYVDQLQNYRFLKCSIDGEYRKVPGFIYRQVFDGLATDADWGQNHAQHQDQRSMLIPDAQNQPVFRPTGAPFSSGTGQLVTEGVAFAALEQGEFESTAGKKWFRIPNGSWYQTWFQTLNHPRPSFKIYYDRWEESDFICRESIWRGFVPGLILERQVAHGRSTRLVRAQIDGAMEIMPGKEKVAELVGLHGFSAFHQPGFTSGEGDLIVHTWSGKDSGRFSLNGNPHEEKPVFASQAADRRFVGILAGGNANFIAVMGTDILHTWLKACQYEAPQAECTGAAFLTATDASVNRVFVYSKPDDCIFCFSIGHEVSDQIELVRTIKLPFAVRAMTVDKSANLHLAAVEMVPVSFESRENLATGFESLQINEEQAILGDEQLSEDEFQKRKAIKRDFSGRFVFSQTGNAVLYVIYDGQTTPVKIDQVFLDKKFFARDFLIKNQSLKDLNIGISELLDMAEKPGNSLAEMHDDVPGFPDQYQQPQKVLIAVSQQ